MAVAPRAARGTSDSGEEAMPRTLQIIDYMKREPFTLSPAMSVPQAIECLLERQLSSAPVVERDVLVGLFSESDALQGALDASYHGTEPGRVGDYMSREVHTLNASITMQEAAELFLRHHHGTMPVLNGTRLVGQLSRRDILCAAASLE